MASGDPVHVGVLSLHNSKETKAICNAIEALGHQPAWLRAENITFRIEDGSIEITPSVDVVANRLLLSSTEQPSEDLGLAYAFAETAPILNAPEHVLRAMHKFAAATRLANHGVPVPDAFMGLDRSVLNEARPDFGELAVYKTAIGTHGGGTWRIDQEEPVNPTVGSRRAFLQDLIGDDSGPHHDVRVYVVDDQIVGAMKRFAPDRDWRTNVSLGGDVEDVSDALSPQVREIARTATNVLDLSYAGVDLVEGPDGWYVLEVNPTAGFRGLFRATGRSPAPFIARVAIERGGATIPDDAVASLADTLDDSMPACRPRRRTPAVETSPRTVGLTEEVFLTGTSGTELTPAKSDTGASRTSIDTELAARIGAGPITNITRVRSGSSKESTTRPVVDVVVGIGGTEQTVTASVEDRSHMAYPVILGRDVLRHYHVDVTRGIEEE